MESDNPNYKKSTVLVISFAVKHGFRLPRERGKSPTTARIVRCVSVMKKRIQQWNAATTRKVVATSKK